MDTIKEENDTIIKYRNTEIATGFSIEIPTGVVTGPAVETNVTENTVSFYIRTNGIQADYWGLFLHLRFSVLVQSWRYFDGNSPWACPIRIHQSCDFERENVNFCYWMDQGTFGCMVPLCGSGFRGTLGQSRSQIGCKAYSGVKGMTADQIPMFVIAIGEEAYPTIQKAYEEASRIMNITSIRETKSLPHVYEYIGWCSWNSSNNGSFLSEGWLLDSATYFAKHIPMGWVLIDDGWMDHTNRELNDFTPNRSLFPNGFRGVIQKIKDLGVLEVGLWHTINAYWGGINIHSSLGNRYRPLLYQYGDRRHFLRPENEILDRFWNEWYSYLSKEGISFVKVDNQACSQELGAYIYPVFDLAEKLHTSLNRAVSDHFGNGLLNCMDLSIECIYNYGTSATSRVSEDYFPQANGYDLKHGNAAAHIMQACYNSIYVSHFVYPDMDMFETTNPYGELHAISRTFNNGPIYITDKAGECDFSLLQKLCYRDGKTIRADTPLLPTPDCLFQLQDHRVFKLFSLVKRDQDVALILAGNFADSDFVKGSLSPSDVPKLNGSKFVLYDYFQKKIKFLEYSERVDLEFGRMNYGIYFIIPMMNRCHPIGLINKYNSPSTIKSVEHLPTCTVVTIHEGGLFAAVTQLSVTNLLVNNIQMHYTLENNLLLVDYSSASPVEITIYTE